MSECVGSYSPGGEMYMCLYKCTYLNQCGGGVGVTLSLALQWALGSYSKGLCQGPGATLQLVPFPSPVTLRYHCTTCLYANLKMFHIRVLHRRLTFILNILFPFCHGFPGIMSAAFTQGKTFSSWGNNN